MNTLYRQAGIRQEIQAKEPSPVTRISAFLLAVVFSVAVTAALLLLMHSLIYKEYVEPVEATRTIPTDIWAQKRDIVTEKEYDKPEPIEEPSTPPEALPDYPVAIEREGPGLIGEKFQVDTGVGTDFAIGQSGMLVKRVAAAPRYPGRAITRGIEGFVDIRFDVTKIGNTENIRIIQSQPEGIFDKAATQAVAKYKYQPAMQGGEPVATKNVTERIRFNLEK
ncbi:energy transducer TonB [Pseudoteredinibacter isoporae]|uniref:Protein TonB n=1 Tax=Pseudoteredinibacter isoporae TaxID=570281 RepID=A0A7X0JSC2_9GAMM|nr:energy transducer TonB [Pseudoteredinibacter isoporae]MBB6520495.1 protein TonB [Pseudoteredinibacter isoporae]NHO86062.1 energy transducer TonB [Pseudoteredinibacter isoporae]NIB25487.1 energy transducer TonB [Pseudoteredinibacter isoporae]